MQLEAQLILKILGVLYKLQHVIVIWTWDKHFYRIALLMSVKVFLIQEKILFEVIKFVFARNIQVTSNTLNVKQLCIDKMFSLICSQTEAATLL